MNQITFDLIRAYGIFAPLPQNLVNPLDSSGIDQEALLRNILSPHYELYAPSRAYQKRFWKAIINILEAADEEVEEDIYNCYMELLLEPFSKLEANVSRSASPLDIKVAVSCSLVEDGNQNLTAF